MPMHDCSQPHAVSASWPLINGTNSRMDTTTLHKRSRLLKLNIRRQLSLIKYAHKLSRKPNMLKEHSQRSTRSSRKLFTEDIKKLRLMFNFSTRVKLELLCENLNFPTETDRLSLGQPFWRQHTLLHPPSFSALCIKLTLANLFILLTELSL